MLHSSTDGGISFPEMPDEWTTDATRPPHIEEDFLINVGLHVNCQDYAPGAKAIALGNVGSPGSWVVNGDGTISPHDALHLRSWLGRLHHGHLLGLVRGPGTEQPRVLLDPASPAGPVFRACGGAAPSAAPTVSTAPTVTAGAHDGRPLADRPRGRLRRR